MIDFCDTFEKFCGIIHKERSSSKSLNSFLTSKNLLYGLLFKNDKIIKSMNCTRGFNDPSKLSRFKPCNLVGQGYELKILKLHFKILKSMNIH